jgi:hypothetical protein
MASEFKVVDSNMVNAGGVTAATRSRLGDVLRMTINVMHSGVVFEAKILYR